MGGRVPDDHAAYWVKPKRESSPCRLVICQLVICQDDRPFLWSDLVIKKQGSKYVLKSKSTGKTLGTHSTKAGAARQERAIQANKHHRGKK